MMPEYLQEIQTTQKGLKAHHVNHLTRVEVMVALQQSTALLGGAGYQ
jgi:hypothetical protein